MNDLPVVRLGSVANSISDTHLRNKEKLIFLNTSDVLFGKVLHQTYSAVMSWPGQAKKSIRKNDILFSEIRPANGRWAFIDFDADDFVVSTKLMVIRSKADKVLPRFLYHFLTSTGTTAWLQHLAESRSGTFPQITFDQIAELELALPPLTIQRSIVSLLDALDDKIELNRRMNETLEAMARAIFKDWFVDFGPTMSKMQGGAPYLAPAIWALFPNRLNSEGKPDGWSTESVLEQANWVNGAAYKSEHFVHASSGLPIIKIAELKSGVTPQTKYTSTNLGERYRINDGELLFSWSGNPDTSIDTFIWTGGSAWLNQHIFAVRGNGKCKDAYLFSMLKWLNPVFTELARNKQTTGLGHVTKNDLSRLPIVTPPPPVASEFNRIVGPILEKIKATLYESRSLTATRDLLLPKLMSGEVRVKDAEKVAEAVL